MSHGPLMGAPENVATALPMLLITIRHPAWAVAEVPSDVGKLPTMTHPFEKTASAVVKPTPPGQAPGKELASISANRLTAPPGAICMMVVPVPWRFEPLLKLLTKIFPRT